MGLLVIDMNDDRRSWSRGRTTACLPPACTVICFVPPIVYVGFDGYDIFSRSVYLWWYPLTLRGTTTVRPHLRHSSVVSLGNMMHKWGRSCITFDVIRDVKSHLVCELLSLCFLLCIHVDLIVAPERKSSVNILRVFCQSVFQTSILDLPEFSFSLPPTQFKITDLITTWRRYHRGGVAYQCLIDIPLFNERARKYIRWFC